MHWYSNDFLFNHDKPYIEQNVRQRGKKIVAIFFFFFENSITLDTWEHILYIYPEPKNRSLDTSGQSYPEKKGKETSISLWMLPSSVRRSMFRRVYFLLSKWIYEKYIYIKEKIVDRWKRWNNNRALERILYLRAWILLK